MFTLALLLGLLTPATTQEATAAADAQAVLAELIERSRSPGAFRAEYHFETPGVKDGLLEISYLPDERIHLRLRGMNEQGGSMDSWIDASRISGRIDVGEGGLQWFDIDLADPRIELPHWLEVLDGRFPRTGADAEYHAELLFTWGLDEETGKIAFNVSVGSTLGPQFVRLGWLSVLQRDPEHLSLTDEAIVQEDERYRATVSRKTGFLEELVLQGKDGQPGVFRLTALDLDPALEPADFLAPARPEGAQDIGDDVTRTFIMSQFRGGPRLGALQRIDRQLARGQIEWRTQTRDDCEVLFRALQEPSLQALADGYVPKIRTAIQGIFEELEERRSGGETPESLQGAIDERRADLVQAVDEGLPALRARFAPPPEERGESEHWDELLALETATLEALLGEHVRSPLLNEFDQKARAFLGKDRGRTGRRARPPRRATARRGAGAGRW